MKDFNSIKAGDKIILEGRSFGMGGYSIERFTMTEWVEKVVEKVTPKFYFVDGEKYNKADNGRNFMRRHYIPGQDGSPTESNSIDFEVSLAEYKQINGLDLTSRRLIEKLPSLKLAAHFAQKIKALKAEIEEACK